MKKIIAGIAVVIAVFSVSTLYAQQGGGGRMDPAAMKQKLKDDLKLTDLQEFRPKMMDIRNDQTLSQDDKRSKFMDLRAQQNKRVQAVLGDDLFKKYQEWQEKNRPQRMGGNGGGGGNQ
jgi:periplasmic protein CpxP/Spy